MLNDGVPPAPGSRKLFGASAQSQRLLINFEPGMGEHSVAALQLEEVSDKVSDKGLRKMSKLQTGARRPCESCNRHTGETPVPLPFENQTLEIHR